MILHCGWGSSFGALNNIESSMKLGKGQLKKTDFIKLAPTIYVRTFFICQCKLFLYVYGTLLTKFQPECSQFTCSFTASSLLNTVYRMITIVV